VLVYLTRQKIDISISSEITDYKDDFIN